jgi:hypothetical protein
VIAIHNRVAGFVDDHLTEDIYVIGLARIPEFAPISLHSKRTSRGASPRLPHPGISTSRCSWYLDLACSPY